MHGLVIEQGTHNSSALLALSSELMHLQLCKTGLGDASQHQPSSKADFLSLKPFRPANSSGCVTLAAAC